MKRKKEAPIKLKDVKTLEEKDWRGILAFLIIGGGLCLIALAMVLERQEYIASVAMLMALVAEWYFKTHDTKKKCPYEDRKENQ